MSNKSPVGLAMGIIAAAGAGAFLVPRHGLLMGGGIALIIGVVAWLLVSWVTVGRATPDA